MTVDDDFDIPATGAVFTFGKSRFADNAPSKFWIKNDRIVELSCGDEHTAVITESGRVFMIGSNDMGQLGLGSTRPVNKPSCVKVLKPEKALHVACGRAHTIVSCSSGSVYLWGHNGDGQLGTNDLDDRHEPVLVMELDVAVECLAAGSAHSTVLTKSGDVYIWGGNSEGQLGLDVLKQLTPKLLVLKAPAVSITCGYYHTVIATSSGHAFAWGDSDNGRIGIADRDLPFHRHAQCVPIPERVIQVAAGSAHTLFLTVCSASAPVCPPKKVRTISQLENIFESGGVYSCGVGTSGQLGQGGAELECWNPQPVVETSTHAIVSIAAGDNHSSAITDNGYLLTWGCGRHGKLCQGEENFASQFVPVIVRRLRHISVVLVGCGGCHTMVLGYRREEEEETATEEDTRHTNNHSLHSSARARRRVTDGVLPPLKSVGLPPIKHTVLPTVPDTEGIIEEQEAELVEEAEVTADAVENGNDEENGASDGSNDGEKSRDDVSPPSGKRSSRFARFFGGLGRKKSSSVVQTLSPSEDNLDTAVAGDANSEGSPAVEEDTHLESIEDRVEEEGEEAKRDVMEAFAEEGASAMTVDERPGHKQSKACVIL